MPITVRFREKARQSRRLIRYRRVIRGRFRVHLRD